MTPLRSKRRPGPRAARPLSPALARRIRLVGFDVDGVLTEGGIFLGDVSGQALEFKRYDIQDGIGIKLLQRAGLITAIITGRVSESVTIRAHELGVTDLVQDPHARKLPALQKMLKEHDITMGEVAFVGDDLPDVPVLRAVGLPVVVANSSQDAIDAAKLRLTRKGGHGAVREFAELLLRARGQWREVVDAYLRGRMGEGDL